MFKNKVVLLTSIALLTASSSAMAVNLKIQSVLNSTGSEVGYVRDFAEDVAALTNGRVTMEILPGGSVVPNSDIIDAVDAGLLDGGFAWTHYWSGKHPAAMLFGSPIAGLVLVLIISHGFLGSMPLVVKSFMHNYGRKWTLMFMV